MSRETKTIFYGSAIILVMAVAAINLGIHYHEIPKIYLNAEALFLFFITWIGMILLRKFIQGK